MKLKTTILSVFAAVALGGAASAATVSVTEGDRNQIIGSTIATNNGSGSGDTAVFDLTGLTDLGNGDVLEIYGRIIGFNDKYLISSKRDFKVEWIFNGYTTAEDGFVAESGFVATPFGTTPSADARITMFDGVTTTNAIDNPFETDITASLGSEIKIFSQKFKAGDYELLVDGLGSGDIDSLYDIRITAVPLPAGGLLLLTALGGLGLARRRRG